MSRSQKGQPSLRSAAVLIVGGAAALAAVFFPMSPASAFAATAATSSGCTTSVCPPWPPDFTHYSSGYYDGHDYSDEASSTGREWGIDSQYGVAAGSPIDAPESGTIIAYQPSASNACDWQPGRILEQLDRTDASGSHPIVAFGHVNQIAGTATHVSAGDELASIGDQSVWSCGQVNHVEFMYDDTGSQASCQSTNGSSRCHFLPPPAISQNSDGNCPRNNWNFSGGDSQDPCTVLTGYMNHVQPGGFPDGAFVQTPDGSIYRTAGGAALHITNCGGIPGGCGTPTPVANLSRFALTVADNENIVEYDAPGGGGYWKAAGGTIIHLTTCGDAGLNYCSGPTVVVNDASITEYNAQHPTVADNENIVEYDAPGGGGYWKAAGGTIIHLTTCGDAGLNYCSGPTVVLPDGSITEYNAQHPTVADNEVLIEYDYGGGGYWKAAGGTILHLGSCSYNLCTGPNVVLPYSSITDYNAQHPQPADGTVLEELPSGRFWLFEGGCRSATGSSVPAITVADGDLQAYVICPWITTASLRKAVVGTAYRVTLSASGGTQPYRWSLASGSVPAGLHLSAAGMLSGTPSRAGTFALTVRVTDSSSPQLAGTKTYTLTVALAIAPSSLSNATANQPYRVTLAASGGAAPYQWSLASGSLPTGLHLSSSGVLSGTPTTTGTFTLIVRVTDSSSPQLSRTMTYTLAVN